MDGVQLCARFSLATNRLEYCGPADAAPQLYRAITRGERLAEIRQSLSRFEALMPYLDAIAKKHGRDPFDLSVVEAYWVGNKLLDAFTRTDFEELLTQLTRRGLPKSIARRLSDHLPERPIPHHAFHVSFVGVGAVTGHVATTLHTMDSCRPAWAKVVERSADRLVLLRPPLGIENGRLAFGPPTRVTLPFDPNVLPEVVAGQSIATHWGFPAVTLRLEQEEALRTYSLAALDAANEARPGMQVLQ